MLRYYSDSTIQNYTTMLSIALMYVPSHYLLLPTHRDMEVLNQMNVFTPDWDSDNTLL